MRKVLLVVSLLVSGCMTSEYEKPLTEGQRSEFFATLPAKDREAFETLVWASEVDQRPIMADFNTCIEREVGQGDGSHCSRGHVFSDRQTSRAGHRNASTSADDRANRR